MQTPTAAIILAAGKGTRMRSARAKVLHEIDGRAMIEYVVEAAHRAACDPIVAVVGHQRDAVRALIGDRAQTVTQEPQLGTGHAALCAAAALRDFAGVCLVLSGDVPLIQPATLRRLAETAVAERAACALLSMVVEEANRYGKIVRGAEGEVMRIVEDKDATPAEKEITEVNAGVYAFRAPELFAALRRISDDNAQGEFYLTDAVATLVQDGQKVVAVRVDDTDEVLGVDTPQALARAEAAVSRQKGGVGRYAQS